MGIIRSRATLTTSGLKQGRTGVGRPGPGRVWRLAGPAAGGRRTRPCSGKQDGGCGTQRGRGGGQSAAAGGSRSPFLPSAAVGVGKDGFGEAEARSWGRAGAASSCPPPRHSLLRHPGVLEGDEDQVQTVQARAVELGVEFVSQLLLQLAVVLLCVHLAGRDAASEREPSGSRKAASLPPGAGRCAWGAGGWSWFHPQLPRKPGKKAQAPRWAPRSQLSRRKRQ